MSTHVPSTNFHFFTGRHSSTWPSSSVRITSGSARLSSILKMKSAVWFCFPFITAEILPELMPMIRAASRTLAYATHSSSSSSTFFPKIGLDCCGAPLPRVLFSQKNVSASGAFDGSDVFKSFGMSLGTTGDDDKVYCLHINDDDQLCS